MAKFDFNNSRYANFFKSKQNVIDLQTFLNQEGILETNYKWWTTQCTVDPMATPTAPDGTATFTQKARKLTAAPMLDLRAPLGKGVAEDKSGFDFYSASIPDFISKEDIETATERAYKDNMFSQFGNDADIVAAWVGSVQDKVNGADATMNFMTAKLMSEGLIDYTGIGQGIQLPLHKANIADENKVKAGAYIWEDTANCKILTQMHIIEDHFRTKWGYTGALVWKLPRDMYYNVFLANSEVKELVKSYRTLNYIASTDAMKVTDAEFRQAFVDYDGVSPIEVVVEKERNKTNTGDSMVHGWNQGTAVLCPAGYVCDVKHTTPLDQPMYEKYGNNIIDKVFAQINGGLYSVINTTVPNGELLEWHTVLIASAVPALNEFPFHVLVDTKTAGAIA